MVYSNEAKSADLKVDPKIIQNKGAVSQEVAEALAKNARQNSKADVALSTTGVAGPGGGSETKPVGLVWIGLSDEQSTQALQFRFTGSRENIKQRASQAALEMLRRYCLQLPLTD